MKPSNPSPSLPPPFEPSGPLPAVRPVDGGGFGIGAVAHMTGIDEHTLRIWERRYGFPHPERSPGGTRQYNAADVRRLKLIRQALAHGHRPREVVGLDEAALLPLVGSPSPTSSAPAQADPGEIDGIVAALRRDDLNAVRAGLRNLAILRGPRGFVVEVATPLLSQVGQLWQAGELEIYQEHLLSQCLSTQLRVLSSLHDTTVGPVVLLATLPDEPHGLGLEMAALYLATAGASPRVIGVSTPVEQIIRAAHAHRAAAVGLSLLRTTDLAASATEIRRLAGGLPRNTLLWLGGSGATLLPPIAGARIVAAWGDLDDLLRSIAP